MEPGAELGPPRPPRTCAPWTSADVDTGRLHCHDIWARGMSRFTGDSTEARKHLQNSPQAQRASRGGAHPGAGPGGRGGDGLRSPALGTMGPFCPPGIQAARLVLRGPGVVVFAAPATASPGLSPGTELAPLAHLPRIPYPPKSPRMSLKTIKAPVVWKTEESGIGVIQFKVLWDDKCVEGGWGRNVKLPGRPLVTFTVFHCCRTGWLITRVSL